MTPIALGYVGAKHRDWSALAAFTISSAVCFLFTICQRGQEM